MQRIATAFIGFICGLALLLGAQFAGRLLPAPQITYSPSAGVLSTHDLYRNRSFPLISGTYKLPVAWSWSPDGKHLAYVLFVYPAGDYEVMLLSPMLRQTQLMIENLPFGSPPRWSPDGLKIAAINAQQDVCIYAIDGRAPDCLHVQPAGQPTWSRDGAAIAYVSRLPDGGLMRVRVADGVTASLFTGATGVNNPVWSPDGESIAFSYALPDAMRRIYVISAEGGDARMLTDGAGWQDQPEWSPDSKFLAYSQYPTTDYHYSDVAVRDVQSGEILGATDYMATNTYPRWSPDGAYLAFLSDRIMGRPHLYVTPRSHLDLSALSPLKIEMGLYAYDWRP